MIAECLPGIWSLISYRKLEEDGNLSEGPLGPDPRGVLIYTCDGQVSVHMMRTSGVADRPGTHDYMGYAGTWRLAGDQVVHTVRITPNPAWVDTEQVRDLELRSGELTLYGTMLVEGEPRRLVLRWRRQAD